MSVIVRLDTLLPNRTPTHRDLVGGISVTVLFVVTIYPLDDVLLPVVVSGAVGTAILLGSLPQSAHGQRLINWYDGLGSIRQLLILGGVLVVGVAVYRFQVLPQRILISVLSGALLTLSMVYVAWVVSARFGNNPSTPGS